MQLIITILGCKALLLYSHEYPVRYILVCCNMSDILQPIVCTVNVTIYWIIYAVVRCLRGSWLPIVIENSNRHWQFWHSVGQKLISKSQEGSVGGLMFRICHLWLGAGLAPSNQKILHTPLTPSSQTNCAQSTQLNDSEWLQLQQQTALHTQHSHHTDRQTDRQQVRSIHSSNCTLNHKRSLN